jgi:hypothetical protein
LTQQSIVKKPKAQVFTSTASITHIRRINIKNADVQAEHFGFQPSAQQPIFPPAICVREVG